MRGPGLLRVVVPMLASVAVMIHAAPAHGHVLDLSVAAPTTSVVDVFIEESEIRVEIETTVPHLVVFNSIFPDRFRVRMGLEPEPEPTRLERFFTEEFVVRADGGPPLTGRVASFETRRRVPRDEITGKPRPAVDKAGERVVFVVVSYRLEDRPGVLVLAPPSAAAKVPLEKIGLTVFLHGLPVGGSSSFDGEVTLDLDWDDPWNSEFRDGDPERPQGSPLSVFLVIEPRGIRVEIIVRPLDVQAVADVGIGDLERIPDETQDEVRQRVAGFLAESFDLTVDGEAVVPSLDRVELLNRRPRPFDPVDPQRGLDAGSAVLGVVFSRTLADAPGDASLTWRFFPDGVDMIPGTITDAEGVRRVVLGRDDHVLGWKRNLEAPALLGPVAPPVPPTLAMQIVMWVSRLALAAAAFLLLRAGARSAGGAGSRGAVAFLALIVVGWIGANRIATRAATVDADRAAEIVSALLENVYMAIDSGDEEMIREALGPSTAGMPAGVLLEARLALANRETGRARIRQVELAELAMEEAEVGFEAHSAWTVTAEMGHWGHLHRSVRRVVADLSIAPVEGAWRITAMDLLEVRELQTGRFSHAERR